MILADKEEIDPRLSAVIKIENFDNEQFFGM